MKKKKAGIIASSVAAIAVCSSMVVGSTLALFTSEDKVNIAVTSGNVSVEANILNSDNATVNGKEVSLTNIVAGENATIELEIVNKSTVSVSYRLGLNVTNDNGLFAGLNIGVKEEGLASTGTFAPVSAAEKESGKQEGTLTLSIGLPESAGNAYMDKTCKIELSVEAIQGNANFTKSSGNVELINSAEELEAFRDRVNGGANYANKYVMLMSDIDLENKAWMPIGTETSPFTGTFNGNNHAISNLNIGSSETSIENRAESVGLFGYIGHVEKLNKHDKGGTGRNLVDRTKSINATISNLAVNDVKAYGQIVGAVVGSCDTSTIRNVSVKNAILDGGHYVGGIVGYVAHESTIDACNVAGTAEAPCSFKATVFAITEAEKGKDDKDLWDMGDKVGGIVGLLQASTIKNCVAEWINISGYRDIGGISGISNNGDAWKIGGDAIDDEYLGLGSTIKDNVAKNIVLTFNNAQTDADNTNVNARAILGRNNSALNGNPTDPRNTYFAEDCNTFENITLPQ